MMQAENHAFHLSHQTRTTKEPDAAGQRNVSAEQGRDASWKHFRCEKVDTSISPAGADMRGMTSPWKWADTESQDRPPPESNGHRFSGQASHPVCGTSPSFTKVYHAFNYKGKHHIPQEWEHHSVQPEEEHASKNEILQNSEEKFRELFTFFRSVQEAWLLRQEEQKVTRRGDQHGEMKRRMHSK